MDMTTTIAVLAVSGFLGSGVVTAAGAASEESNTATPKKPTAAASNKAKPAPKVDLRPGPDTRTEAQKTMDRNMQNANEVAKRKEAEANADAMRDKRHDGRVKVGKTDTSVGVSTDPPGGNVRTTTK